MFDAQVVAVVTSGSGDLSGNTTCSFVAGLCTFQDLGLDTMGDNYTVQFELVYPTTADVTPVISEVQIYFGSTKMKKK